MKAEQADYRDRLLEIHGPNMFSMFHVDRALEYAKKLKLTGLIFHCNSLLDLLVLPGKYFPKELSLARWPVREATLANNNYYMRGVLQKCGEAGLEFYAEVKELYYPPEIVEIYPNLQKENGAICPTEPFWREFLEEKVREFFEKLPDAAGIIVSPGTRESMVSLAANGCVCERCKNYNIDKWYAELISAMYRPIAAAGKRLVIRDFSYTKDHQFAMVDAAKKISSDITMAMKKTPHDYYPTFPDNPAVGNTGTMRQWIEYDTWGQYFGLGVFPCSVAEDMRGRMRRYLDKGASGVMLRTDWEIILESSVFHSFNMLNLYAGAMLSYDVDTPPDEIYRAWISDGLFSPLLHDSFEQKPYVPNEKAAGLFIELMKRGWKALEKLSYMRGHVFQENVQPFDSFFLTYKMMTEFHSRDDWDSGASQKVEPTDENIAIILKEKDEGVAIVKELPSVIKPDEMGLSPEIKFYLEWLLDMFDAYAEVMRKQAKSTVLVEKARRSKKAEDIAAARATLDDEYDRLAARIRNRVEKKAYSPIIEFVLDGRRIISFKKDCIRVLDEIH